MANVPISLHRCTPDNSLTDDVYLMSTVTEEDGTFNLGDLEEGSYRLRITPVVMADNGGGSEETNDGGGYRFVTNDANEGGSDKSLVDSDVNEDGTTDCIVIGNKDDNDEARMQQYIYAGMIGAIDNDGSSVLTVKGSVFLDMDGDGIRNKTLDASGSTEQGITNNIVIDLYDCANSEKWILLTRTNGNFGFEFTTAAVDGSTTTNLTELLMKENVRRSYSSFSLFTRGIMHDQPFTLFIALDHLVLCSVFGSAGWVCLYAV